jgi:hypothetical protein
MVEAMDGVLKVNELDGREGNNAMEEFHPELAALLADPITHRVMASDKVDMVSLLTLLRSMRRHLRATAVQQAPARVPEPCGDFAF